MKHRYNRYCDGTFYELQVGKGQRHLYEIGELYPQMRFLVCDTCGEISCNGGLIRSLAKKLINVAFD